MSTTASSTSVVGADKWLESVEAICQGVVDQVLALGDPEDPSALASVLDQVDEIATRQVADIRALGALPGQEEEGEELVAALENQRAAGVLLREAVVAGDQVSYEAAADEVEATEERLSELATELGVPACGP